MGKSASFSKIREGSVKDAEKRHKERMDRCIPVAREFIKIIGDHADTIPLGDVEKTHEGFRPIASEMLQMLLDKNVNWVDRKLVFQIALQAFDFPSTIAQESMEESWNTLLTGLFGKHSIDLTMEEVDTYLRKGDIIESAPQDASPKS